MPTRTLLVPTLLVATNCDDLAAQVRGALAQGEDSLTLDFSRNAYTDDAGCLALVSLGRNARAAGGPLVLRNPPRTLSRSLLLSGLATVFQVEHDAVPAMAAAV